MTFDLAGCARFTRRWLSGIRPWTGVVAINASIMTLYLWHLTAMVGVIGTAYALDGFGLGLDVNTPIWWLTRPLFLLALIAATLPFLALFGGFERPRRDARPAPPTWKPIVATVAVCGGLTLLAQYGVADQRLALAQQSGHKRLGEEFGGRLALEQNRPVVAIQQLG